MSSQRPHELFGFLTFAAAMAAVLCAAALLAPRLVGRSLTVAELIVGAIVVVMAGIQWRALVAKRKRERLDHIRDSALW